MSITCENKIARKKLQNVTSISKERITDMKRNVPKRRISIAAMLADFFSENSDVSLSAEMEPSTVSTQKENIKGEYGKYSHPWAHLKFEDREQ